MKQFIATSNVRVAGGGQMGSQYRWRLLWAVSIGTVGILLTRPVSATAQSLKPAGQLRVVNADGVTLGSVVDFDEDTDAIVPFVAMEVGSRVVLIEVRTSRLTGTARHCFQSSNCTGPPWFEDQSFRDAPIDPVVVVENRVYARDPSQSPATITCGSSSSPEFGCEEGSGYPGLPYSPAMEIGSLESLARPPYRVVSDRSAISATCGDCNGDGKVTLEELLTGVQSALMGQ